MSSVRRPEFQIRGPAAPKLLSPKLLYLCVRGTYRTHVVKGRPEGPSVAFRDETDIISQVCRRLTTQCLTHQTGEFELHSAPNWKPVQLTQHRRNVVTPSGSGDEACCRILQRLDSPHDVVGHSIQKRVAIVAVCVYYNQCTNYMHALHSNIAPL